MARLPLFLLLLFTVYHIQAQKNSYWNAGWYQPDYSPRQEKYKVCNLAIELLTDVKHKIHMTDEIRSKMEQDHTFLFHVGTTLGTIRELYKSQLEMYRQMRDKFNSRNRLNIPEYRNGTVALHFLIAMEEIYAKEVQIENHIHALMKVPAYQFEEQGANGPSGGLDIESGGGRYNGKPDSARDHRHPERPYQKTKPSSNSNRHPGMFYSPPKAGFLRSGDNAEEAAKSMSEDDLKRMMRAQFYQRHKS